MPHWPTATTRRSPCVAALVGTARLRIRAPAPNACRNLRRFIGCDMRCLLPGRLLDDWSSAGDTERLTVGQGLREVKRALQLAPENALLLTLMERTAGNPTPRRRVSHDIRRNSGPGARFAPTPGAGGLSRPQGTVQSG